MLRAVEVFWSFTFISRMGCLLYYRILLWYHITRTMKLWNHIKNWFLFSCVRRRQLHRIANSQNQSINQSNQSKALLMCLKYLAYKLIGDTIYSFELLQEYFNNYHHKNILYTNILCNLSWMWYFGFVSQYLLILRSNVDFCS